MRVNVRGQSDASRLLGLWVPVAMLAISASLALAFPGSGRVLVDDEAAGHGWFVDPTPGRDEEFLGGVARPGTGAEGRVDLLTVLMHEMGHLAGRGHTSGGLMGEILGPGTRALDALDAAFGTAR